MGQLTQQRFSSFDLGAWLPQSLGCSPAFVFWQQLAACAGGAKRAGIGTVALAIEIERQNASRHLSSVCMSRK
jgi:hypothetical protein